MIRRFLKYFSMALAALVLVQGILWLTVGIWSLPRKIPSMIELDVEATQSWYAERGKPLPESRERETFVLCNKLVDRLGERGMAEMVSLLEPLNILVIPEAEAPVGWRDDHGTSRGFARYCYNVEISSPIYARINYYSWRGGLSAQGTVRSAWFILGFWVTGDSISSWVS